MKAQLPRVPVCVRLATQQICSTFKLAAELPNVQLLLLADSARICVATWSQFCTVNIISVVL